MRDHRPVNLNLLTIRFPCTAIASIAHRMSGVLNFLLVPVLIYMLQQSLSNQASFDALSAVLGSTLVKLVILLFMSGMTYHILAGIRHLVADCEVGESLLAARVSAYAVFVLTAVLVALEAYWLW